MKLDSNLAWQSAHAAIMGNREVLLALAGVFFFLPSLAFALLYPQPEPPSAMTPDQAMAFIQKFYGESLPFLLAVSLIQMGGAMAILTLITARDRPTVGSAIGKGFVDLLTFFGATLLSSFAAMLVAGIVLGIAAATGVAALVAIVTAVVFAALIYLSMRIILVMPVVAIERIRNPIAALRRSWVLTKGNAARIAVFTILLLLVYFIITMVVTLVLGLVLTIVLGTEGTGIAVAVVSAALGALFSLYIFTSLAMIHRQLAGLTTEDVRATFD